MASALVMPLTVRILLVLALTVTVFGVEAKAIAEMGILDEEVQRRGWAIEDEDEDADADVGMVDVVDEAEVEVLAATRIMGA